MQSKEKQENKNSITNEQLEVLKNNFTLALELINELLNHNPNLKQEILKEFLEKITPYFTDFATNELFFDPCNASDGRVYEGGTIDILIAENENPKSPFTNQPLKKQSQAWVISCIRNVLIEFFPALKDELHKPNPVYAELKKKINKKDAIPIIVKFVEENKAELQSLDNSQIQSLVACIYVEKNLDLMFALEPYFPEHQKVFHDFRFRQWEPFPNAIHYAIWHGKLEALTKLYEMYKNNWSSFIKISAEIEITSGMHVTRFRYNNAMQLAFENKQTKIGEFIVKTIPASEYIKLLNSPFAKNDIEFGSYLDYTKPFAALVHQYCLSLIRHNNELAQAFPPDMLKALLYTAWLDVNYFDVLDLILQKMDKDLIRNFIMTPKARPDGVRYPNLMAYAISNYENLLMDDFIKIFKKIKEVLGDNFENSFLSQWDSKDPSINGISYLLHHNTACIELRDIFQDLDRKKISALMNVKAIQKCLNNSIKDQKINSLNLMLEIFRDQIKELLIKDNKVFLAAVKCGITEAVSGFIDILGEEGLSKLQLPKTILESSILSGNVNVFILVTKILKDKLQAAYEAMLPRKLAILTEVFDYEDSEMLATMINIFAIEKLRSWLKEFLEVAIKKRDYSSIINIDKNPIVISSLDAKDVEELISLAYEQLNLHVVLTIAANFPNYLSDCIKYLSKPWGLDHDTNVLQYMYNFFIEDSEKTKALDEDHVENNHYYEQTTCALVQLVSTHCPELVQQWIMIPVESSGETFSNLIHYMLSREDLNTTVTMLSVLNPEQIKKIFNTEFVNGKNYLKYICDQPYEKSSFLLNVILKYPKLCEILGDDIIPAIQILLLFSKKVTGNLLTLIKNLPIELVKRAIKSSMNIADAGFINIIHCFLAKQYGNTPFLEFFETVQTILQDEFKPTLLLPWNTPDKMKSIVSMLYSEHCPPLIKKIFTIAELKTLISPENVLKKGSYDFKIFVEILCHYPMPNLQLLLDSLDISYINKLLNTDMFGSTIIRFVIGANDAKKFNYLVKLLGKSAKQVLQDLSVITNETNVVGLIRRHGNADMLKTLQEVFDQSELRNYFLSVKTDTQMESNSSRLGIEQFIQENKLLEADDTKLMTASNTISNNSAIFWSTNSNSNSTTEIMAPTGGNKRSLEDEGEFVEQENKSRKLD